MKLTAENVKIVFIDCLFEEGADTSNHVKAEGVKLKVGFDPIKLKQNELKIIDFLNQLPAPFRQTVSGGWTFLNGVADNMGNHWAEHPNLDQLLCLGLAIGKLEITLPREMWGDLPGCVPYFTYLDRVEQSN